MDIGDSLELAHRPDLLCWELLLAPYCRLASPTRQGHWERLNWRRRKLDCAVINCHRWSMGMQMSVFPRPHPDDN